MYKIHFFFYDLIKKVEVSRLEGEKESSYWDEIIKRKNAFRNYLYSEKQKTSSKKLKKN